MSEAPARAREVNCPVCSARTLFAPSNRWRPFCSARCKQVDLGAWASDQYRIEGAAASEMDQRLDDSPGPRH